MEEPIASIIWATPRIQGDVQELVVVSEQLALKYGKEFAMNCKANNLHNVNEKLVHKLGIHAPPRVLVEKYMEEIAKLVFGFLVLFIYDGLVCLWVKCHENRSQVTSA